MGWCHDINSKKYYNRLIKTSSNLKHEKLFRWDYKYDFFIPIKFNWKNRKLGLGSAIFIHLTKNYIPTAMYGLAENIYLNKVNKTLLKYFLDFDRYRKLDFQFLHRLHHKLHASI